MKYIIFKYHIFVIRMKLRTTWRFKGWTEGLCILIEGYISCAAANWFNLKFREGSSYPNDAFWLGHILKIESYKNRMKYLNKFEKLAIDTGAYKNGWEL